MSTGGVDDRPAARELLANIKRELDVLADLLDDATRSSEDLIYRFWHHSMKVYGIQGITLKLGEALRGLTPAGCEINPWFEQIVAQGTGFKFDLEHNQRWLEVTRPQLEALFHARYLVEMAVKYGRELNDPPNLLPSGWAALLEVYQLR